AITCYDSIVDQLPKELIKKILIWLADEYAEADLAADPTTWRIGTTPENAPQQTDGSSCGVFTCAFANLFSADVGVIDRDPAIIEHDGEWR
ncbi:unnamed protein product, partial [Sphacelaria rigidula]